MKPISMISAKPWSRTILLIAATCLLINMTGCSRRFVVVNGDETVQAKKSELDRVYQDNELLLKALEQCKGKK